MKTKINFVSSLAVCFALAVALFVPASVVAAVAGTATRWIGNQLVFDGSSGNNAIVFDVDGLRAKFGSGAEVFFAGNSTHMILGTGTGAGYLASATPFTIDAVYVNNTIDASDLVYGGRDLPARAFTYTSVAYRVRTAGSGGSSNNTFVITGSGASTGVCNCTFACNQAQGEYRATCATGSGVGCAFAASTNIAYSITDGDCTVETDVQGNMSVEGIWQ